MKTSFEFSNSSGVFYIVPGSAQQTCKISQTTPTVLLPDRENNAKLYLNPPNQAKY